MHNAATAQRRVVTPTAIDAAVSSAHRSSISLRDPEMGARAANPPVDDDEIRTLLDGADADIDAVERHIDAVLPPNSLDRTREAERVRLLRAKVRATRAELAVGAQRFSGVRARCRRRCSKATACEIACMVALAVAVITVVVYVRNLKFVTVV